MLQAWHEVDNALDALTGQHHQYAALLEAYEQNRTALHAAQSSYRHGAADYLSVLTAQRSVLSSQTQLNRNTTAAALSLVNLYKALGGGWEPDDLNLFITSDAMASTGLDRDTISARTHKKMTETTR